MKKSIKTLIAIIIFSILNATKTFAISDLSIDSFGSFDLGNVGSLKWVFVVIGALLIVAILYLTYQSDKRGDLDERTSKFDLDTDTEEIIKDKEDEKQVVQTQNEEIDIKPINENEQYNSPMYNQIIDNDLPNDNNGIVEPENEQDGYEYTDRYDDEYEEEYEDENEYEEEYIDEYNVEENLDYEENANKFESNSSKMNFEVQELDDEVPTFSSFEYVEDNEVDEEKIVQNEEKNVSNEIDDADNFFSLMEENLIKNKEEREKNKEKHDDLLIDNSFTTEIESEEIKPKKITRRKKEVLEPKEIKVTKKENTTKSKTTKKENEEQKTTKKTTTQKSTTKKTTKKEE